MKHRTKDQELDDREAIIEHYKKWECLSKDPEQSAYFKKCRMKEVQESYKAFPELNYDVTIDDYDYEDEVKTEKKTQTELKFGEVVKMFFSECVDKTKNLNHKISATELYMECMKYCSKNSFIIKNIKEFGKEMKTFNFEKKHTDKGSIYIGLKFNEMKK